MRADRLRGASGVVADGRRTWLVTRHAGARDWAVRSGLRWDETAAHLDPSALRAGDRVFGTLPAHLAAAVCAQGAEYWHLCVDRPEALRGAELDADTLAALGARFVQLNVEHCDE